ncbi:MFS transporter [Brevibacillus humidisoli]|uniref:CynX/NimT family MFS transporter n=1 Tax=Brevibacillus humidisoli TaxID=2895522 RepID=UPI001E310B7D|nr:MFS transporter [Brevibacillus humidisoli]UFJ40999.1 MFS transporter [Brevibacillus humidisoli]
MLTKQAGNQRAQAKAASLMLIFGIVIVAANLRAPITVVGPIIGDISHDLGISHAAAGVVTTLPLLAFALLSPFAPRIARRFGLETTIWTGMILLTAGIILRSSQGVVTLFLGTALLGLAIALGNVLVPSLVKRDFPERVGVMTGVYTVSMNLWGAIASGVSIPIAQGLGMGWSGALGCWAILSTAAILVWLPQLRFRKRAIQTPVSSPVQLWRSRLAWQVTLFMGLQSMVFYVTIAWLPEILQQQGMTGANAGWMLSLMQFVVLPVTFLVPVAAGRRSSQRGLAVTAGFFILIGLGGLLSGFNTLVAIWVILLGIGAGASFSLAMMFFVLRSRDPQQSAELSGMAQSFGYLLAAAGPTLFGWLHDVTESYTIPLLLLMVVSVLLIAVGTLAGRSGYVTVEGK